MKVVTLTGMQSLGVEKVSKFAACIYINYLVYMNGSQRGYSEDQIKNIKASEIKRVAENFDSYINGVIKALQSRPNTITEEFFHKAYIDWYGTEQS